MVKDLSHSECPSMTNTKEFVEKGKEIVFENHHTTLRELSTALHMEQLRTL